MNIFYELRKELLDYDYLIESVRKDYVVYKKTFTFLRVLFKRNKLRVYYKKLNTWLPKDITNEKELKYLKKIISNILKKLIDNYSPNKKEILGNYSKFTLRLSKKMSYWLENNAFRKKMSKADYIRYIIKKEMNK